MTDVAPKHRGLHISGMDTSKVQGVLMAKTSSERWPMSCTPHVKRFHTPEDGTTQPFGLPVEPDVYMMYITSGAGQASQTSFAVAVVAVVPIWRSSMMSPARSMCKKQTVPITLLISATTPSKSSFVASTATVRAPASVRMSAVRAIGHVGSQGTKVEPARNDANWAMGSAADRLRTKPTTFAAPFSQPVAFAARRKAPARD
mmetsp:Transcript_46492/g.129391  ORF Transcript_46492/g.129391 Transcript_46492/m.129391 type:complete len:202 (+) Transcript_46492:198-803(+)